MNKQQINRFEPPTTNSVGVRLGRFVRPLVPPYLRPTNYLARLAHRRSGGRVMAGPFANMRYVGESIGSVFIPKILGIYEQELYPCVEKACSVGPDVVVDAGAAEGYYAVGLALRNPSARVVAFEMDAHGRRVLAELASLNKVGDRLEINGRCEASDLQRALVAARRPLVICDVEGYEQYLLDPVAVPALRGAHILVELHDFCVLGITDLIRQRFTATHQIEHILQGTRLRQQFPWRTLATRLMPQRYIYGAVYEWRPVRMAWFWMEPKATRDGAPS